jgi:hypothetical protein
MMRNTAARLVPTLMLTLLCFNIRAADPPPPPEATVYYTAEPVVLDGKLDEPVWQNALPASNFWQYFPADTNLAEAQTELYFAADEEYFYVGIKCYTHGDQFVTRDLKRDYRASDGDNITLVIDPFRDQTNAFIFGLNPFGVQREALISGGGLRTEDFLTSWDNKWYSEAKIYDDYWIGEVAIPFKTLRFREGEKTWYFNSYRFDTQINERSTWVQIPRNQIIMNRAYNGVLHWEKPLRKPGANVAVIPYVLGGYSQDFEEGSGDPIPNFNLGGDAKIGLGPALNLDLTINPDFSQVEVDRQVTNLDRFEIFFPERRQFFLENSDLFANLGTERLRPFFSRRIGIAQDTATGVNVQNTIYYGARLSGKITNKWRIGLLNMQTAADTAVDQASLNYTVATLQRQVFERSFLSFFFVNQQNLRDSLGAFSFRSRQYNRVVGSEFTLASADNAWNGKYFFHLNLDGLQDNPAYVYGTNLSLTKRAFQVVWDQQYVGSDYEAEVGFIPRTGFTRIAPEARLFFYPSKGWVNTHGPGVATEVFWDDAGRKTDHQYSLTYAAQLSNQGNLNFSLNRNYTYLFEEFDPSRSDLTPLPAGTDYEYTDLRLSYSPNRQRKLYASWEASTGQYFHGYRSALQCSLTYRIQPIGSVSASANYNRIDLPLYKTDRDTTINLLLISPRLDLTFTRSLFFTLFTQYNSQLQNVNINARLQWRFKPVSDLFIVYVDNYGRESEVFQPRNRSLTVKLTYWLNV